MTKKKMPATIVNYFAGKRAMIIDESEPNRAAMVRALIELGMQHNNISSLKTIDRASFLLKQRKPHIVVTEMSFGEREVLKLLREQRELFKSDKERLSIVVTSNSTESTVAAAAEEEVDCYIIKPYSPQQLIAYAARTAIVKLAPNPYLEKLEEGRKLNSDGDLDAALAAFQTAISLNEKPCMAHYHTASTLMSLGHLDQARIEFERGLTHNELHYKCILGYCDLLEEQLDWDQAYETLRRASMHFPLSPHRIYQLTKMAINTLHYEDILQYFEFYIEIEERPPELVKIMAEGLLETGKFAIYDEDEESALDAFSKGISVSGRSRSYIFDIVQFLIESEKFDLAKDFLVKCDPSSQESEEFQNFLFLIESQDYTDGQFIEAGRRLIKEGKAMLPTFIMTISRLRKLNKPRALEDIVHLAIEKYPDQKSEILKTAA